METWKSMTATSKCTMFKIDLIVWKHAIHKAIAIVTPSLKLT